MSGLDFGIKSEKDSVYRVLARKYRPQDFTSLIGQEPMVRTLKNAFETGRIAQAWMLTGVRGVGKTTTARILARALNYSSESVNKPTVDLSVEGTACRAILEGHHPDIVEMDAASNTGIDSIREIIEQVRYKPLSARYKVYIIDEVHMLSTQAFNGLLKTLEEPPAHVKFIFATTEIRKVPITILSRCQRFDLRRVEADVLVEHLAEIARLENVTIDQGSLNMIARASEGSVRDSLSLLDQAIAHGSGVVEQETVRSMLGLADRSRIIDLFEKIMLGDVASMLENVREQYNQGADPVSILSDLAEFCHLITRMRYVPSLSEDKSLTQDEREKGSAFSKQISIRVLSRAWQMLTKGIEETNRSSRPIQSAEMALIRLCYASTLPTLDEALKAIEGAPTAGSPPPTSKARSVSEGTHMRLIPQTEPAQNSSLAVQTLHDIVALASNNRDMQMKVLLQRCVRMGSIRQGVLEIGVVESAPRSFAADLSRKLSQWTGTRWMVSLNHAITTPTLEEETQSKKQGLVNDAKNDPNVAAILAHFAGSRIINIKIETAQETTEQEDAEFEDEYDEF